MPQHLQPGRNFAGRPETRGQQSPDAEFAMADLKETRSSSPPAPDSEEEI